MVIWCCSCASTCLFGIAEVRQLDIMWINKSRSCLQAQFANLLFQRQDVGESESPRRDPPPHARRSSEAQVALSFHPTQPNLRAGAHGVSKLLILSGNVLALKFLRFQTNFKGGNGKGLAKGSVSRRAGLAAGGGEGGKDGEVQRHERSFDQGASVTMILQFFVSTLIPHPRRHHRCHGYVTQAAAMTNPSMDHHREQTRRMLICTTRCQVMGWVGRLWRQFCWLLLWWSFSRF